MLSLPKLLALGGVVWLVFFIFRKMDSRRRSMMDSNNPASGPNSGPNAGNNNGSNGPSAAPESLDLEECSICGAWVAGKPCDREQCPYRT